MMAKLKAHLAAMFAFIGGGAGLKEYLGVQLSEQTVTLLKYIVRRCWCSVLADRLVSRKR